MQSHTILNLESPFPPLHQKFKLLLAAPLPLRRHLHIKPDQPGRLLSRAHVLPKEGRAAPRVQVVVRLGGSLGQKNLVALVFILTRRSPSVAELLYGVDSED